MKNKAILLLLLVAFTVKTRGAIYYVDFATGNNSNNGTATGTPFKHCPGDTNATSTAASTTLAAGDTVKFKGGIVYTGSIGIAWSGSAGNPIIYDGNHTGDWGTGRAIVDGDYVANRILLYASAAGRSYITVRGFELRNAGGYADDAAAVTNAANGTVTNTVNTGGTGLTFYEGGHTNIYVENLYIHRIGQWRNTQGWIQETIGGAGVTAKDVNGIVITNCEMTKMSSGVGLYAGNTAAKFLVNALVTDCNIHDYIRWGIDVATMSVGSVISNVVISGNEIHDYEQYVQGNWTGTGEWPHTDGVFLRTAAMASTWQAVKVFNNHFYCDGDVGGGGTACIYVSQGASAEIFNNLFNNDSQSRIIGIEHANQDGGVQIVRIYNNTFVAGAPFISIADETDPEKRKVYIQNNIFRQLEGSQANYVLAHNLSGTGPTVMDNNLYWSPGWTSANKYTHAWPSYTFFDNVESLGIETNGLYADPLFVDFAATPSERDLRLQSNSPAIGAGTNLSAFFTTDKDGNNRPGSGAWDVGAYIAGAVSGAGGDESVANVGTANANNLFQR